MVAEGGNKTILIVDDDANIRRFLTESMRLHGFDVHSFEDAESALQVAEDHHFDIALLDILLPGTNGLQLCRQLRSSPKTEELPIIMMTAFYKQADHIREAREDYGATDYLLKPFPLKALHEKVNELIGSSTEDKKNEKLRIEGTLNETDFPRIIHNLYSLQTTGLLHLENNGIKKVVYIRNGYPIFVRSNLVKEFLGQRLIKEQLLTREQLEESLEISQERGQKHGITLVEMGLLTPHQLNDVLRNQVLDKLLDIFAWTRGSYRFVLAREFKQNVTSIDLSPANLILQGLRQYTSREQLLNILEPHYEHYLQEAENPLYRFQEIELTGADQRILEKSIGNTNLRDVLKKQTLSRKEVEPLLAAMLCTGILVGKDKPDETTTNQSQPETEDLRTKRQKFLKDYAWMMDQDYFTLLGVNDSDGKGQIRNAYYSLVKKYHPDRFFEQNHLPDLKDKVNALFQRISDAHETLVDARAKSRYVSDLKGETNKHSSSLETILEAETAYQKGMVLFRVRKYDEAEKAFSEALEFNPNEAEYMMYQAWTAYKADPNATEVFIHTRKKLMRVIELNPKLSQAHLYLGYICKDEGNEQEAQRRFERAIQHNPNCTEALRELRLMNMRKGKADKGKKGLFGKMFS